MCDQLEDYIYIYNYYMKGYYTVAGRYGFYVRVKRARCCFCHELWRNVKSLVKKRSDSRAVCLFRFPFAQQKQISLLSVKNTLLFSFVYCIYLPGIVKIITSFFFAFSFPVTCRTVENCFANRIFKSAFFFSRHFLAGTSGAFFVFHPKASITRNIPYKISEFTERTEPRDWE